MCGVIGILSPKKVAVQIHDLMIQLQHRGQDAAGIITATERFNMKIGTGLVKDVFTQEDMNSLDGNMGIGHVRYPTAGSLSEEEAQPFWIGSPYGIAMAHNGQLTNYNDLAKYLKKEKRRHLNTQSDSETLIHLIACGLEEQEDLDNGDSDSDSDGASDSDANIDSEELFFEQLVVAIRNVMLNARGSYSVVSMILGKGLIGFRDPHGIRPLVMGERVESEGVDGNIVDGKIEKSIVMASENAGFYALGFTQTSDILPGELVYVGLSGKIFRKQVLVKDFRPCMFETVYFSRPDAKIDDISVYRARLRLGQNLALRWQERFSDLPVDVVIPIPFTSNTAALSFATKLGVRYSEGLYKNPFIGRTFIMPDDKIRKKSVRYKLAPQETEIRGKHIILVDDSIVRGTTSREIVKMVRESGAASVYLVSTCPEIKHPCFYGIDIPTEKELIASKLNLDELKIELNVDALLYQDKSDLAEALTRRGKYEINKPCMACLDGDYFHEN